MKKIYSLLLLCLLFFSLPIQAEDTGNLKIDTDLQTPKEDRDISYLDRNQPFQSFLIPKRQKRLTS